MKDKEREVHVRKETDKKKQKERRKEREDIYVNSFQVPHSLSGRDNASNNHTHPHSLVEQAD